MNNGTKSANIMTWNTYKKKFNPVIYKVQDNVFGNSYIQPTMRNMGFKESIVWECDEDLTYLEIIKQKMDYMKLTYIVYHVWKHRSGSDKGMYIFYI